MRKVVFLGFFAFAIAALAPVKHAQGLEREKNLILTPARMATVQMSFDLARLRPATIISCEERKGRDPLLHVWDGGEWLRLEMADLAAGNFLSTPPTRIIALGGNDVMPDSVLQTASRHGAILRVASIRPVDMANALTEPLELSRDELAWLAKRHNLNLLDLSEDQKKRDPYDVPWSEITPNETRYRLAPASRNKPAVLESEKPAR